MVGTAAIRDECGSFTPILTNPIITLPPNVLSTYVPPYYSVGSTYTDLNVNAGEFVGRAEPLTIADLQCPTFGLGIETSADGNVYTTVGPPWLPIIIPPSEVFTLDPVWETHCTELASYYVFESFAIFDPPFALVPESYLVAPPPVASSTNLRGPPHTPANPTAAYDPPSPSDPPSSSAKSQIGSFPASQYPPANAAQPAAVPLDSAAKPTTAPDPSDASSPGAAVPLDSAAKPTSAPDPSDASSSEPQEGDDIQLGSPGLESSISNVLGNSNSQSGESGSVDPTHIIPVPGYGIEEVTFGGQIISISPSGVYLSGTSYSPGGPPITLSGGVFSLVSTSPVGEAIKSDEDPPTNDQPFAPTIQTIEGQTVVSNTSGVYVAGLRVTPGGTITASNKVISLSPAGTLVIGSSSVDLSLADTQETSPSLFNFDGVTVQAERSAAVIGGITLTPGGPGTFIGEKSISLEQDGTINIGTSLFALPTAQETTPKTFNLDGMAIQAKPSAAVIDGITLIPGEPGTKINGNSISLEQGGTLDIGTNRLVLPVAQETTPSVFKLDGMTVQLESSAILINGITLIPGYSGIPIDGTHVSLEQDRTLDIGSSHFALPPAAEETPPNGFNVDGMTVQAQQSAVVVNGITLTPGGPGTTIDGSSVRLESGGTLDIGTGRFAIPTGSVNGTSIQAFEGAQEKAHRMSRLLGLAAILVWGLWIIAS